jgi:hypothetical protein
LAAAAALFAPPAHPAVTPVEWCGGGSSAADRPDVVGGDQVHVVYAVPSDSPDRFTSVASAIATDIGAIGRWWRKQDPGRTPRFDLAAFRCSGAGSLDLSDVRLPHPTAYYNQPGAARLQLLRDDLLASGLNDSTKKYLVYYDQAQPAYGTDCGSAYVNAQSGGAHGYAAVYLAPNLGGCGSTAVPGGYLAVVAAHELVSELGALEPAAAPPHRCPGDALHVCDSTLDVLAPTPSATTLAAAILDYGHDDYYAHSGSWRDVQDSPWLRRLDAGEYRVRVTVGAGGKWIVDANEPNVICASPSCAWTWQAGSQLRLTATAADGFRFLRWSGCPTVAGDACLITVDGAKRVRALFARPLRVTSFRLRFSGGGLRLTARLRLNVRGRELAVGCNFGRQPPLAAFVRRGVATCVWTVPARYRGHPARGSVRLRSPDEAVVLAFRVRVPAAGARG